MVLAHAIVEKASRERCCITVCCEKTQKCFNASGGIAYSLPEAGSDSELSSESSASELDKSMRCARAASDEGTVRRESGISSISSSDSEPPCTQVTNGDERITNSH